MDDQRSIWLDVCTPNRDFVRQPGVQVQVVMRGFNLKPGAEPEDSRVFVPLGLITGLLGNNVSGIPGASNPRAFATGCLFLLATTTSILGVLRWKKWL